jgi:hypothetical protein
MGSSAVKVGCEWSPGHSLGSCGLVGAKRYGQGYVTSDHQQVELVQGADVQARWSVVVMLLGCRDFSMYSPAFQS